MILFLLAFLFFACTKTDSDTFSHESVRQAAERYYTFFIQGDAKRFVEGIADSPSFSEDYSRQMQSVVAQAAKELARKGGVVRVEATFRQPLHNRFYGLRLSGSGLCRQHTRAGGPANDIPKQ